MPRILAGSRKSNASKGESAKMADRQRRAALDAATKARASVEILQRLSVALPPTGLHGRQTGPKGGRRTVGYDPSHPLIRNLSFSIAWAGAHRCRGTERIGQDDNAETDHRGCETAAGDGVRQRGFRNAG
jgi:hypothetical protein